MYLTILPLSLFRLQAVTPLEAFMGTLRKCVGIGYLVFRFKSWDGFRLYFFPCLPLRIQSNPIVIHINFLALDKIRHIDIPITLLLHTYANKKFTIMDRKYFLSINNLFLFNIFFMYFSTFYSAPIDIWAVGCIMAELYTFRLVNYSTTGQI